jgi:glycosyltransferase involved in cell wall biosynthesis
MLQKDRLEFVIPIYNEAACLPELLRRLFALRDAMPGVEMSFLFVDDGSSDSSRSELVRLAETCSFVRLIILSRNFGHQIAVSAGLDHTKGDYVCIIDGDLQDPPELIEPMYRMAVEQRLDVVYGKRRQRKGETRFKLATASLFYRLLRWTCRLDIPADTGDFRLVSRKVVNAMGTMRESHRFLRAMVPWLGFRTAPFLYERDGRYAGETKYPFVKMLKLAVDAILSFSSAPLRLASYMGIAIVLLGALGLVYMLYLKLFTDRVVPGLTVILTSLVIVSGVQILMLGIIGEYVGRVFEQVKQRPLYLVDSMMNIDAGSPALETDAAAVVWAQGRR